MNDFTILDEGDNGIDAEGQILFRTASEFSVHITQLALSSGNTLTQTIIDYCDDRDIEPNEVAKLISKPLKDRIQVEMEEAGLLAKDSSAAFE
jgi:hypoxanthine-guanine phosphoribosyltransferase